MNRKIHEFSYSEKIVSISLKTKKLQEFDSCVRMYTGFKTAIRPWKLVHIQTNAVTLFMKIWWWNLCQKDGNGLPFPYICLHLVYSHPFGLYVLFLYELFTIELCSPHFQPNLSTCGKEFLFWRPKPAKFWIFLTQI